MQRFPIWFQRKREKVIKHMEHYAQQSTLHGVPYIFNRGLPLTHRLVWLFITLVSLLGFYHMVKESMEDWLSPPILTFDTMWTPVTNYSFPAISMCTRWLPRDGTFNLIRELEGKNTTTPEERDRLIAAKALCGSIKDEERPHCNYSRMLEVEGARVAAQLSYNDETTEASVAYFLTQKLLCMTTNQDENGVFLKNSNRISGWIRKKPRQESLTIEHYFTLKIAVPAVVDPNCAVNTAKYIPFQVFVHEPAEAPGGYQEYLVVKPGYTSFLELEVEGTDTFPEVQQLALSRRLCYFPGEYSLDFFRRYSQNNCIEECLMKLLVERYGCDPTGKMLDVPGVRICPWNKTKIQEALGIYNELSLPHGNLFHEPCDCLPVCNEASYKLRKDQHVKMETSNFTEIRVYFKRNKFRKKNRSVKSTFTDFLANCAGFLGLFLGVGILTTFEILYQVYARLSGRISVEDQEIQANSCVHKLEQHLQQAISRINVMDQINSANSNLLEKECKEMSIKINEVLSALNELKRHIHVKNEEGGGVHEDGHRYISHL